MQAYPHTERNHPPATTESLLASESEIIGILAELTGPMRRSSRNRHDAVLAQSALAAILSSPVDAPPVAAPTSRIIDRVVGAPQRVADRVPN